MNELASKTVAEIVLDHPETARIFQKHRIDYCCRGNVTIAEACAGRPSSPNEVLADLRAELTKEAAPHRDPRTLSTPALVGYIVDRHHRYLRERLPYIGPLMAKVARVHGQHNPKLVEMKGLYDGLADTLEEHIDDEEKSLFPALTAPSADGAALKKDLREMLDEHIEVGAALERLRDLADDYSVPEWGCTSYRTLFAELRSLEADVLTHVHLENHALAPRFDTQRSAPQQGLGG